MLYLQRDRAYRRWQRRRYIIRRMYMQAQRESTYSFSTEPPWWSINVGRYSKSNGVCSCRACRNYSKATKWRNTKLAIYRHMDRLLRAAW